MDTIAKRQYFVVAFTAVPCLMLLALLVVQQRAHEAIAEGALRADLVQGQAVVARLLEHERAALGRAAALALSAGAGIARGPAGCAR